MKSNRSGIVILWAAIGIVSLAAIILGVSITRSRNAEIFIEPAPPDYWPTQGWQSSKPEEQGIDSVKLAEGLQGADRSSTILPYYVCYFFC